MCPLFFFFFFYISLSSKNIATSFIKEKKDFLRVYTTAFVIFILWTREREGGGGSEMKSLIAIFPLDLLFLFIVCWVIKDLLKHELTCVFHFHPLHSPQLVVAVLDADKNETKVSDSEISNTDVFKFPVKFIVWV